MLIIHLSFKFIVYRNPQYKDLLRKTIEILQRAHILRVNSFLMFIAHLNFETNAYFMLHNKATNAPGNLRPR